jgi:GT2 family glycosyltransferase
MLPLVTILIATKDRPDDLRRTLRHLRHQQYPEIELLIIDDGSQPRIEAVVREESPQATYIFREQSAGQSKRRSEGIQMAKGDYILQLDDDSYPVHPDALRRAVQMMQTRPKIGILSFYIFNGEQLPEDLGAVEAKYHSSFVGCGALIRSAALNQTVGYREFFGNEWEEEELSMQVMKAGWAVYFFPDVLIHHHISPRNRLAGRTWMRGFRNRLWAIAIHFPARRLLTETGWVLGIAACDAVRLLRFRAFAQGVGEFIAGLPRAVRLRDPMSDLVLRRYDAMRFGVVRTEEEYNDPPKVGVRDLVRWFHAWWKRPRQRSFWDRRAGDIGQSATVKYAHEYPSGAARQRDP